MNDKLVRLSDAISAVLADKISGQQLEIIRALGSGIQAETLNQACNRHAQYIRDLPAVNAVVVRHARWIKDCDFHFRCSVCGDRWVISNGNPLNKAYGWNFCPNCGARMDGEDGDA